MCVCSVAGVFDIIIFSADKEWEVFSYGTHGM